jgi:hypothetical protein
MDKPILVTGRSKAWVCSRLIDVVAGPNSAEDMDVRLLCGYRPLRRTDHSFRGVLQCADACVSLCVCVSSRNPKTRWPRPNLNSCVTEKNCSRNIKKELYIYIYIIQNKKKNTF